MGEMLPNFLKNRAFLTPNREAIVYKSTRLTFQELYEKAYRMAGVLFAQGIREESYVAFLVKSDIQTVISLFSLQIIGAKAVLLNNRLTVEEMIYQIKDAKVDYLLTEDNYWDKGIKLKKQHANVSLINKNEMEEAAFMEPPVKELISLDAICTIMYTSGTTGVPKGVIQTYGNHWWSAVGNVLNAGLHQEDVWLCTVPIFHISGYSILMRSVLYGMKIVLHDSFHVQNILQDIREERVTIMSVVTTMLKKIEQEAKESFPAYFRYMLLGGGPVSIELLSKCSRKGIPVYYSYGMTETASQIVTLSPEDSVRKIGSAGKALFPAQIKIVNEQNEECPPHEMGEIAVSGPNVTRGYLNKANEEYIINGWFNTGDIGYKDMEGFLYVVDRRSDLIISGGENIYPAEVESVISSIFGVKEVAVIGVKEEEWGQVPVAFIVTEEEEKVMEKQILNVCQGSLAKYKIPKKFFFISKLPRNASGKLVRRELRNLYERNQTYKSQIRNE